jgi:large-conductance mechanosensitive channel
MDSIKPLYRSSIERINDSSSFINNKMYTFIASFFGLIRNQLSDFIKFLIEKNIVQMAIGVLIATQVSRLVDNISDLIITPISKKVIPEQDSTKNDLKKNIFNIEFHYGKLIIAFLQFLMIIVFVYFIWKLTKVTKFEWLGLDQELNRWKPGSGPGVVLSVSSNNPN